MKKFVSLVLISLFCICLCSCGKPASSPIEDFTYEFEDGEAIITGYIGTDLEIVVPDTIEERPVTTIGNEAFIGYDMKSIYIPSSVTTIEGRAFYNCTLLSEVDFNEGITKIHDNAFGNCEKLSDVTLPDSIRYVSKEAFYGSKWYDNQSDGVVYSGNAVLFYKGNPLEQSTNKENTIEVYINEGTKIIADEALNNSVIRYIHIPESVTYIGENAIYKEEYRELVTLYGKSDSIVESYAFENYAKFISE